MIQLHWTSGDHEVPGDLRLEKKKTRALQHPFRKEHAFMVYLWFIYGLSVVYLWLIYLVGGKNIPLWKMMELKSVGMMTFPTEWKNNPNVPNHQPVFDWNNHGDDWSAMTRGPMVFPHEGSPRLIPFFWGVNIVTVASNRRIIKPIPRNHMEIPRKNPILSNLNPKNPMIIL